MSLLLFSNHDLDLPRMFNSPMACHGPRLLPPQPTTSLSALYCDSVLSTRTSSAAHHTPHNSLVLAGLEALTSSHHANAGTSNYSLTCNCTIACPWGSCPNSMRLLHVHQPSTTSYICSEDNRGGIRADIRGTLFNILVRDQAPQQLTTCLPVPPCL